MIANIKDNLENRLLGIALKIKVNPNILTLASILSMAATGYEIVSGNLHFGTIFLALSGILDLLDGTVAKAQKERDKIWFIFR